MLFATTPQFSGYSTVLTAAVVVLVLAGSVRSFRRLRKPRRPMSVIRFYLAGIYGSWVIAALAFEAYGFSPGVSPANVGLVLPNKGTVEESYGVVVFLSLLVSLRLFRRRAPSPEQLRSAGPLAQLLPRTAGQRWLAAGLAVTAGVTEEFVYRGLLIAAGVGILGLSPLAAAGLALLVFAIGHLYQGPAAVFPALFGIVLTGLYLMSGSLLPPVLVHIVVDLVGLAFARQLPTGPSPTVEPSVDGAELG